MTYGPKLIWLGLASIVLAACNEKVPCFTKGAERNSEGVCDCPDGMHREGPGDGVCVSDDVSAAAGSDGGAKDGSTGVVAESGFRPDAALVDAGQSDSAVPDDASNVDADPVCLPSAETCDGMDNDCDGAIDEDVTDTWAGQSCSNGGQGACNLPGTYGCASGAKVCSAPSAVPSVEVCDGMDNDCKDGVDNGFMVGSACSVGQGECKAAGVLACTADLGVACSAVAKAAALSDMCGDGKDNDCNGKIDDGKNDCGMPCGATCPSPAVCGNGKVEAPEECDPTAAGWSTWTCSTQCKRQTIYRPCATDAQCTAALGEKCDTIYAYCTKPCTAPPNAVGVNSGCPTPGGNLVAQCAPLATGSQCLAIGCNGHAECGTGASCVGSGTMTFCLGCDRPEQCPSGKCVYNLSNEGSAGSFGVCQ